MRTVVIIEKKGTGYLSGVSGKFGGGHFGARAGLTAHEAAATAAKLMIQYARSNDEGGDLIAPEEVFALVPKHLHTIEEKK